MKNSAVSWKWHCFTSRPHPLRGPNTYNIIFKVLIQGTCVAWVYWNRILIRSFTLFGASYFFFIPCVSESNCIAPLHLIYFEDFFSIGIRFHLSKMTNIRVRGYVFKDEKKKKKQINYKLIRLLRTKRTDWMVRVVKFEYVRVVLTMKTVCILYEWFRFETGHKMKLKVKRCVNFNC